MIPTTPVHRRRATMRLGLGLGFTVFVMAAAAWWWWATPEKAMEAAQVRPSNVTAKPADDPAAGNAPSARTEFPAGSAPVSGPQIVAALSDHTALLPGGFVEYYAPDGTLHGLAEEKHYGGRWDVRNGAFCTLLEGSDASSCSLVRRVGAILYWSMDGEPEASPVNMLPGNPQNLK